MIDNNLGHCSNGSNGSSGRKKNGQFAKGSKGGPGGPRDQAAYWKRVWQEASTVKRMQALIGSMFNAAIDKGDVAAANLICDRLMGKPKQEIDATVSTRPINREALLDYVGNRLSELEKAAKK